MCRAIVDAAAIPALLTAAAPPADGLSPIAGAAADLIEALGEWGVGLLTFIETMFPPIPSEVILPLAGYLTTAGTMSIALLIFTSTLGAYLGALVFYWAGAALGMERPIRWFSRLPLVDREDFEKAAAWFTRYGRPAVFFGRFVPGVRSLISLPAGADRMGLLSFSIFTIAGSGIWNGLLIGLGALLGTQYELINQYSQYLDYAVYLVVAAVVAGLLIRGLRRRKPAA